MIAATDGAAAGQVRDLCFTNDLAEIARLGEAVEEFGESCGLTASETYKVNLVLDELLTNLISYAYPDQQKHLIRLRLSLSEDRLTALLIDDAGPFDPLHPARPAVLDGPLEDRPIGGLGLHFVRTLMDEVSYERVGDRNQLTLVKQIARPGAP